MPSKLMDYFNKSPRIGTLSTADKAGNIDSGVFGSPRMTDEKTVVMGLGKNRTLANLQQNPHAVYLIMDSGATLMDWKGIRVYLKTK
ncbi:MAG: pyridoxamine 5'-phosphate oxidase family protein, partial [Deltaproteobacteria bacterium]|nr:pyridoxamine 5'-phosphate oxidase family protein [Deltaproteobacteria bacterium]